MTINELESKENDINSGTMNLFETDEQVMMLFDTIVNEIRDGGDNDSISIKQKIMSI